MKSGMNFHPSIQYEVRSALAKCGLTTKHIESQIRVLSGGEQAKVRLCKLVNRDTNILLLDEPTNHLDVDAKEALKKSTSGIPWKSPSDLPRTGVLPGCGIRSVGLHKVGQPKSSNL